MLDILRATWDWFLNENNRGAVIAIGTGGAIVTLPSAKEPDGYSESLDRNAESTIHKGLHCLSE